MNKRGKRKLLSKKNFLSKVGQVWIETVIYTLIAFVMIGLVLSYAQPKIQQLQDQTILQQSTTMLKQIDTTIATMGTTGNQRVIELGIKQGELKIDGVEEKIIFQMDSKGTYSEPGKVINDGNVQVYTEKKSGYNTVTLTLSYGDSYDLEFEGQDIVKTLSKSSTPYKFSISNDGADSNGKIILNISIQ
jgi:hypothetical protein